MTLNHNQLLTRIRSIHAAIRDAVVAACEQTALEQLSAAVGDDAGDTIFAIDRVSEETLLHHFAELADTWPLVLIAEGLGTSGVVVLPAGTSEEAALLRVIVDPIDGTRGLMYQKRPAWILTGVALNHGPQTNLTDIEIAVMTEIPLVKQHLCDSFWAIAGHGTQGERFNRLTGATQILIPQPSRATTIAQGFGMIARFFPGGRDILAAVDDAVIERVLGPQPPGRALAFEDQYISTGGQLYELLMGHDRWIADLRPLLDRVLAKRGRALGLCCHPYDLATELVAREAGIVVCDAHNGRLSAPLDVTTDMAWIGYANPAIRDLVAPALATSLREAGLLE